MNRISRRYYFQSIDATKGVINKVANFILLFFNKNYYRKNKNILNTLFFFKNIINRLKWNSLINRDGDLVEQDPYLKFHQKDLHEIEYGIYTSPCIIVKAGERVSTIISNKKNSRILFGIGVLDEKIKDSEKYDIKIEVKINDYIKYFTIPINRGKLLSTSIGSYFRGKVFLDLYIDLPKKTLKQDNIILEVLFSYFVNGKIVSNNNSLPKIAIKSPQQIKLKALNRTKKIIIISCESLTDPFWLEKVHSVDLDLKGIKSLADDSIRYTNSFAQQDATLPFMSTLQTGLYSSQHRLGNYNIPPHKSQIDINYKTFPKILKRLGFINTAFTPQGRWDTTYKWARGFDEFVVTKTAWDRSSPSSGNISRSIQKNSSYDSFMFFHIDRVHQPILQFVENQSPNQYNIDYLSEAEQGNWYPALFYQIKSLDKIVFDIINTLKYEKVYDNSLIFLTGDHGVALPPLWVPGLDYALYDEHIRVPFMVKWPNWYKKSKGLSEKPFNASTNIFKIILDSLDISLPKYFNSLNQNNIEFDGYAFSETIYHPKKEDYTLAIMSEKYKYVVSYKIDWRFLKVKEMVNEQLFEISKDNVMYNENDNVSSNRKKQKTFNEISKEFISNNLSFNLDKIKNEEK